MDFPLLIANLSTLPSQGLRDLIKVLPADIRKSRKADQLALVGDLRNVLDYARSVLAGR